MPGSPQISERRRRELPAVPRCVQCWELARAEHDQHVPQTSRVSEHIVPGSPTASTGPQVRVQDADDKHLTSQSPWHLTSQSAESVHSAELPAPRLSLQFVESEQVTAEAWSVLTSQVEEPLQVTVPPSEFVLQSELSWHTRSTLPVPWPLHFAP